MVKSDFEIVVTGCVVAGLLALMNFNLLSSAILNFTEEIREIRDSGYYTKFESLKRIENEFWAKIKGTEINKGNLGSLIIAENTENQDDVDQGNQTDEEDGENEGKLEKPLNFLLVGDSMMLVGFGPALEQGLLGQGEINVVREGQYSTGLNRVDYYDWYSKTDELIAANGTDVLVVMFGANDGQGIVDLNGTPYQLKEPQWKDVYRQRVNTYLTRFSPKVQKIYWIGHPIAGDDDFMWKFQTMNEIYKSEIEKFPNVTFVDTWERFSINGKYSQSIPDDNGLWQIAKQSDGVHVTDFGGGIMSNFVMKTIKGDIK
jgi:uncharacterized protein